MKAAINKIKEGAQKRDTIGRNICLAINTEDGTSAKDLIVMLEKAQLMYSSDNLEKITNVILFKDNVAYLVKYRMLDIANIAPQAFANVRSVHEQNEAFEENKEGDDD